MIVRLLLSVVFAVALLTMAMPAVEDARHSRQVSGVERAANRVVATAESLVDSGDPPPSGVLGARRTVQLHLPEGTALVFPAERRILELHVNGRRVGSRALPRTAWTSAESLRFTGSVHVTLRYVRRDGAPVLVVTRGFIRESEAKKGYALDPPHRPAHVPQ